MGQQQLNKKRGFITIASVLILGFVAIAIVTSNLNNSTFSLDNMKKNRDSYQALKLAESCAENAINTLKSNLSYTGNETLNLPFGDCTISAITGTGNSNRTFEAFSTFNNQTRRVAVSITTVNPLTSLASWKEIQ